MANLSVRKLDNEVVSKIRLRAVRHGVSMEEEVRRIITQAVSAPLHLGDMALATFGADFGVDFDADLNADLTPDNHTPHEPPAL